MVASMMPAKAPSSSRTFRKELSATRATGFVETLDSPETLAAAIASLPA